MKLCYLDESGTGSEPIAVMAGIVVDSNRMHLTKDVWNLLLIILSDLLGREVRELHTRDFYSGNGIWRGIDGPRRSSIITAILKWLKDRKHRVIYSVIHKERFNKCKEQNEIHDEIKTIWRALGFHLVLALQKAHKKIEKPKGNTILIFDNENREEPKFTDIIKNPPDWSDSFYSRDRGSQPLNQIVDVPYFADSCDVALIQLADFLSFFIRRYVEIKENLTTIKYDGEDTKLEEWMQSIVSCSVNSSFLYPKRNRCLCAEMFYKIAPDTIRNL